MWKFWLIVAGLSFVIESFTVGFLVFWFGIGALIALVSSFFIDNLIIQAAIFVVSSSILIVLTKPLVKKFIKNTKTVPTNVYSLLDKEGLVLEDIDSVQGTGKVKVKGELWSATADIDIPKNSKIKVVSVNGVKLKVEKVSNANKVN